uniref:Major facilitator superfamily (MFS) profile domain-containing protein n=1 Tax=Mucochytrium quahogii TaxID=96639 RepID=A0A7S2RV00_9STRA|mmetsp:Transcript_19281/g.31697  ORF Transcript_19281/g.31697 Transcript_19281/m.31697 type:complete len:616 (+) Transcript_19281:298-2145(+)
MCYCTLFSLARPAIQARKPHKSGAWLSSVGVCTPIVPKDILLWDSRGSDRRVVCLAYKVVSEACDEVLIERASGIECKTVGRVMESYAVSDVEGCDDGMILNDPSAGLIDASENDESAAFVGNGIGDGSKDGLDTDVEGRMVAVKSEKTCCDVVIYQTVLLCLTFVLLFADQNLLSPNLSQAAQEFNFTTVQRDKKLGGDIALGFFCIGGFSSLLVGSLTDLINRTYTLVVVLMLGETACFATYWVKTYEQLFVLRSLTGISVGGSVPLIYSLFGDLHSNAYRGKVIALAGTSMGLGVGFGQIIAGTTGPSMGWRFPFLVIAIPAYVLGILLLFTTKEPKRGTKESVLAPVAQSESFHYDQRLTWNKLKILMTCPSVVIILLQGLPGSLPFGVMIVYFNDYLAQEMRIPVEYSTIIVVTFGGGLILGQFVSGYLNDRWFLKKKKLIAVLTGISSILSAIPIILIFYVMPYKLWLFAIVTIPAGFLAGVPIASIRTLMLNVTMPEVRGSAFSILNLVDDLGKGLGPFFVSLLLEQFPYNRREALAISMTGSMVSGILLMFLAFTLDKDVGASEQRVVDGYLASSPAQEDLQSARALLDSRSGSSLSTQEYELTSQL